MTDAVESDGSERFHHSIEVRQTVLAGLLAGKTVTELSELHGVPRMAISLWKSKIRQQLDQLDIDQREMIKLNMFAVIIETQNTLKKQLETFSNTEWLTKQSAKSLTVLHGVLHDKIIRLFEALAAATQTGDDSTDEATVN